MLLAQLNFHADVYTVAIEAPQLAPLQGRELRVAVRAGMAGMSGQATLDGTQLDDPMCSVSYADMSPAAAPAARPALPSGLAVLRGGRR